jgi:kynurenine formamidase
MAVLLDLLKSCRVFDLAQPYFTGMPHFPTHPPYLFSLTKKHGDLVHNGISSSADALALGSHVGTHIDALCHFSRDGKLHGGIEVATAQSYGHGIGHLSIDTVQPIIRRGVLLDIAGSTGVDSLSRDFAITPEHFENARRSHGVSIHPGDIVLVRTGWGQFWDDPVRFIAGGEGGQAAGPGPELAGAHWLSEQAVFAAGADTVAFEKVPSSMPVHVHLLVESGIHIIENLNLEDLASAAVYEFLLIALPLKIRGATGSPIRPIALAAAESN